MSTPDATTPGSTTSGFKAEVEQRVEAAKASVDRAKRTVDDVKKEVSTAVDERRGGPATSVEDAEAKAARLREGIARDLAALQARVPDPEEIGEQVRRTALVVGGSVAGVGTVAFLLGRRRAHRAEQRQLREQAEALAEVLARAEHIAAEPPGTGSGSGRWRWLLVLTAIATAAGAVLWQRQQASDLDVEDLWGPEPD
ncbi:MAG: hypothetical protein ACLFV0_12935 [Nitriliruptoraceae bacterium]